MATTLSALDAHQHPWASLLEREDVVLDHGMLHLVHDDVTPAQARVDDLLLIASTLEGAGIPVLLIRHSNTVPALVVDDSLRQEAFSALISLCSREPLYAKTKGKTTVPLPDVAVSNVGPSSVRIFRPRRAASGGKRYGVEHAARVEFWHFGEELIEAPLNNALTRRITPAEDIVFGDVTRFGREWRTISGMFEAHPSEITHDIDMVFSWVDGSSTEFQRQRAAQMAGYVVGEGDDGAARFRHVDELRYALRSVHMYAPWVRRIFIATDSPRPAWLADDPRVTIVRSEEFFEDPAALPTHNSHAVESQLHKIDGLAEHFLYSNDDMFFGRAVQPEMFFTPGGLSQFVECEVRIGTGNRALHRSGHDNALRLNRELLQERFGRTIVRDLEHCATPLRRSVMQELEQVYPEDFARTAASRFRAATDISVTNCLYHYYALFTGRAVATTAPHTRYVQTTLADSLRKIERLDDGTIDMFCLNDGGETEVPEEVRVRVLSDALERMFPVRAPWELPSVSAASSAEHSTARSGALS
ncbi:hypothetical protein FHX49_000436 [Microbacterium endophyticum]|uniref:Sugar phosphotransferase n=1 Tax=Microbacterium endophyticum TaxID=1526412 RepID=A0A7W4V117_9MICO|nr:stealth family protein [Microbacterium endophyticum]MBB2974895.1 hypothetical protein [Microbacterium endophyticum]NIK37192.1 hypothetical protein [Microbacterium endophyticum]